MIQSFKSRSLRAFWEKGDGRRINPALQKKVRRELDALEEATDIADLEIPGFGLHALSGDREGQWALTVSRNWRITFRFEDGHAHDVNFEDYH